ncbi:MAG: hypothetical protein KGJ07_03105, partial [Patescibacteria group bacterium]|nr:hypothetical protein [Patescibacteria group bacterium]
LVYALDNPTNFQRIQTGGVNKVEPGVAAGTFQTTSGTPITAEVVGIGSATPSLFTIDGSVVVIG